MFFLDVFCGICLTLTWLRAGIFSVDGVVSFVGQGTQGTSQVICMKLLSGAAIPQRDGTGKTKVYGTGWDSSSILFGRPV